MSKEYSTATQTGTGTSAWTRMDPDSKGPYTLNLICSGTVNATVEFANEKTLAGSEVAIAHAVLAAKTTSSASDLLVPATAFRVVVNSGDGTAKLNILEA